MFGEGEFSPSSGLELLYASVQAKERGCLACRTLKQTSCKPGTVLK